MQAIDQIFVTVARLITDTITSLGVPPTLVWLVKLTLPAALIVAVYPAFFAFLTWMERKVLSRIQNRYGPNRVGPFGLLQPVADGMKVLSKEDIVPKAADPLIHLLAPVTIAITAVMLFSVLPYGRNMVPADIDVGILMFFAMSSVVTIALFWAGWGSRNKFSLLGAMRAVAQMISYELPVVMTAVPAVMIAGSMRLNDIVLAQGDATSPFVGTITHWFVWQPWGFVGFLAFFVAGMAELNRSPFDIAEGESEIIAGFHTEYSGFKFAMFQMGEYLAAIAFSGLATTLFLGGWNGPAFLPSWFWFFGKMFALLSLMMWIRGTLPRLRADQLMAFSWKLLLPLAFINIAVTGTWHHLPRDTFGGKLIAWVLSAVVLGVAFVVLSKLSANKVQTERRNYPLAKFDPPPVKPAPVAPAGGAA